jgi:cellulose synthase/poly-beta-1,6-N-acetylglucosamine synthase-like glycosyltransferase
MTKWIFWASAAFIFYVYVGYVCLLWLLQKLFPCRISRQPIEVPVSLLVTAYNEADVIEAKIRNSLLLDYPASLLEIVIASDGSTDATVERVKSLAAVCGDRVRLFAFPENRGKVAVLNASLPKLRGSIVVLSDASSMLAADSVRQLVSNFADPRVGAVSGVYRVRKQAESSLGTQEGFYWKYETFLKIQEAKAGCLLGAHGSLYAIRKELYPFPDEKTINDDFLIPSSVVPRGFLVAYDPHAIAYEEAREMDGFNRRIRIMAGNVEQLRISKELLRPFRPLVLLSFFSHKGSRPFVSLAMVTLAISNLMLLSSRFYATMALMQILFYGLVVAGMLFPLPGLLRLPYYFCRINVAVFAWLYHSVRIGRLMPSRRELDALQYDRSAAEP